MMEEKRVREAAEGAKKCLTDEHLKVLIELAEAWLARKMPEKKEISPYLTVGQDGMAKGWNAAIDACRLAYTELEDGDECVYSCQEVAHLKNIILELDNEKKRVVSEEEMAEVIDKWYYKDKCFDLFDDSEDLVKDLAHAIAEYVNGKG